MCDCEMAPHMPDAERLPMVSPSDLCYTVSLFYCFEKAIDWHRRKAEGTLKVYPDGHTWKAGEPQPEDENAKNEAIGKAYWTETLDDGDTIRHYFEPCPEAEVSLLEASFGNLKSKAPFEQANSCFPNSQHVKVGGGRCPYGGWQMGKTPVAGNIRHYTKLHEALKKDYKKNATMNRIRAADTAALAVIRTNTNREQLEAKRKKKKRKASSLEEEEEEDLDLPDDLD